MISQETMKYRKKQNKFQVFFQQQGGFEQRGGRSVRTDEDTHRRHQGGQTEEE